MADITIAGASYADVPSILIPLTDGSGYAEFSEGGGGGGISGFTELYRGTHEIAYTSTSAGMALEISGYPAFLTYPFLIVTIENTDQSSGALKFQRSCTAVSNRLYATGGATATCYGSQQFWNSASTLSGMTGTSYGLWAYTINTTGGGCIGIRGRCNSSYYPDLSGTYDISIIGCNMGG